MLGQLTNQIGDDESELWEENLEVVQIFGDMMTQWNVGMSGVVGMRYESLPVLMRFRSIPHDRRSDVFRCVQVMERAALEMIHGK